MQRGKFGRSLITNFSPNIHICGRSWQLLPAYIIKKAAEIKLSLPLGHTIMGMFKLLV